MEALGKIPVDVTKLGCDFLVIAGHKFHGPRIGAVWIKVKSVTLKPKP